ncbi:MAG: PSD1 and planctomycete cytochrome C domain-containing protein [Bryobacteraceae bacterium]
MRRLFIATLALGLHAQTGVEFFETRIRPVLATRCYSCHSSAKASGGLALDSKAGVARGGSRGAVFVAGEPESSLLIRALSHRDALKMPPTGKLPDQVIEDFRNWIRLGAPDPRVEAASAVKPSIDWEKARRHWSFQPVRDPQLPAVRNAAAVRTPVDQFLLARLESTGLSPAPPASKRALLRRLTFDLTGLPPTPDEISAFVNDRSADAYEKVVERLLSSPHYGERWARHWFDLVRFAETNGHEFDFYKFEGWRYRDYVIRAFNSDLPYDRFVQEQLAADLMPARRLSPDGRYVDSLIASGFLGLQEERNGATDLEEVRTEMRDSRIDVFGKTFLGLTIACARCHDHKFDPIPTEDYYALGGIIDSTRTTLASVASPAVIAEGEAVIGRMRNGSRNPSPALAVREGDELFDSFDDLALPRWHLSGAAFRKHDGGVLDSSRLVSNRLTGILVSRSFVPNKKYIHVRVAGTKFSPVREEPSKLAVTIFAPGRYPKGVAGDGDRRLRWKTITLKEEVGQVCHLEIADRLDNGHIAVDAIVFSDRKEPPTSADEVLPALAGGELEAQLPVETFGRVSYEDAPSNMHVHVRGNHLQQGAEVDRHFLTVLGASDPAPYRDGSGRAALAKSLTDPANPLFARVMVNRIWKHHFGEGIVGTVDNFGLMGERPSHPELLDWLASRFIQSGWSVKAMHRLIVLSNAYRMSSAVSDAAREADPRNRMLSHMPVRRLDAESIRDAILSVAGSLDPSVHGPSVTPYISEWQEGRGKPESGPLDGKGRRSVYLEVRRNFLLPLLLAFDYPLPATTMGRRAVSSVPAQALALLNNEFVNQQAAKWAERTTAAYSDPTERLNAMYESAFARRPDDGERARIQRFLAEQGTWTEVAHVLFNAKEFLFLE